MKKKAAVEKNPCSTTFFHANIFLDSQSRKYAEGGHFFVGGRMYAIKCELQNFLRMVTFRVGVLLGIKMNE